MHHKVEVTETCLEGAAAEAIVLAICHYSYCYWKSIITATEELANESSSAGGRIFLCMSK